jgi:hypothetical protein
VAATSSSPRPATPERRTRLFDGGDVRDGEYYRNVSPARMRRWLRDNFTDYTLEVDTAAGDIRATATR